MQLGKQQVVHESAYRGVHQRGAVSVAVQAAATAHARTYY